ncbi:MAG: MFS transporter [Rhodospirillales bacterium]|nr:MFS transporter [Rhodospirillales bacterium]
MPPPNPNKIFYGWWVVAAVFVMLTISSGLGFYNLPIFLRALVAERGFSVNLVSFATAFFFISGGAIGLIIARLIDRFDPRFTLSGGACIAGLGLFLIGKVTEPWQLFAAYFVFAVGFSGSAFVPGTTLVARWFAKKRSIAISLATSGLSMGGVALTPLSAWMIGTYGLAEATQWLAGIYIIGVVPIVALLIRANPAKLGLYVDGEEFDEKGQPQKFEGMTFPQARKTRYYIFVTATFVFALMTQVGAISHQFKLIADRVDIETAALGVSFLAGASMIGRLLGGWVLTKVSMRSFTVSILIFQAMSLAFLALANSGVMLLIGAALFGATVGNALMLLPLLLADAFGVKDYARIYANSQMMTTFGIASGPAVLGMLYSATGGYYWSYMAVAATALISVAIFLFSGPAPNYERP